MTVSLRACAFLLLATAAAPALSQANPPPTTAAPPPACTAPEHRQFDFWLGYWDVYPTGKPKMVAHSLIEKLYAGCTIRENWRPFSPGDGGSLNLYDPVDKRWHQTWQDNSNARVEFDGGMVGSKMVLMGFWAGVNGPGQDGLIRMSYTPNPDGSVRQFGEISTDHSLTWSPSFDFTYKRSKDAPPN